MNVIAKHLNEKGFLDNVAAKDVMIPITKEQILKNNTSLSEIFKQNDDRLPHTYYVVNTGGNTYGILNLHNIVELYNEV